MRSARRAPRTPRLLAALAAGALALLTPAVSAHATGHGGASGGTRGLYTPPANPDAYGQISGLVHDRRYSDAAGVLKMVRTPQAAWFGEATPSGIRDQLATLTKDAARQHKLPVVVLYNIPGRDCSNYSAGGAADTAEYKAWIDGAARGIAGRPVTVVLEPDGLALQPADCGQDDAQGTKTAARYTEINYAVDTLEPLAGTRVYLDTGHPAWHSVNSIVPRLLQGGVARAAGFYTNASNYRTDDDNAWYGKLISSCIAYVRGGGDAAACPNQYWPRADAQTWLDANVHAAPADMAHFVTDTSRNGQGPWTPPAGKYTDAEDWCNPPGRGLGARPTLHTGDPLQDAKLWIKTPGESDGKCFRGTGGPADPERGMEDPAAGAWFSEQALELVHLAVPKL